MLDQHGLSGISYPAHELLLPQGFIHFGITTLVCSRHSIEWEFGGNRVSGVLLQKEVLFPGPVSSSITLPLPEREKGRDQEYIPRRGNSLNTFFPAEGALEWLLSWTSTSKPHIFFELSGGPQPCHSPSELSKKVKLHPCPRIVSSEPQALTHAWLYLNGSHQISQLRLSAPSQTRPSPTPNFPGSSTAWGPQVASPQLGRVPMQWIKSHSRDGLDSWTPPHTEGRFGELREVSPQNSLGLSLPEKRSTFQVNHCKNSYVIKAWSLIKC
jgi:hypothetical protein